MSIKVGIPRALLYYYFYPQWLSFFQHLGVEPVVSHKTTRGLLEKGLRSTVDEACLPVKLAVGHVLDLKDRVDYLFLPRMVSMARREYICPKFLGFPDMVRNTIDNLPPVIDINLDLYRRGSNTYTFYQALGKIFTKNPARIYLAYRASCQALGEYCKQLESGLLPGELKTLCSNGNNGMADVTIAVIGHPYNIYDRFISMDMIKRLSESGVNVVTADHLAESVIRREAGKLPKQLFWTLNQRMIGAAYRYFNEPEIHGLIHVASFGCGPDSMTGELIERFARSRSTKPLLVLTLDEHTGEAGMVTRLEAFLDMVRWRRNLADVAVTL
ncbi:Predicted nucleotide-binding protein, sugar kinase/HSP70/actin superfamily [Desulfotomaculum arcticum]|uniref:Predicted nucleotide-binding protein, sugar kinase/HSP70/actin superfamily n=1 Tax=Desulfotruncus arcticus DSM 17038 TaxID=1121424 RepID=A0A1I2MSI8_9FIRM|nr:acyl-CoA dehydratase activase-related protein [Desulfotruncus arcticus]SFF94383.1 Predicted nucleotide-binding protein, sugar kinase/HSP70/actin superfamily [Desulfotomaculum arcticum] [Desulfotruncus arcticus DSM 17038]